MTAINKMVEWLESKIHIDTYDADIAKIHLKEARRLALEEAKEKPTAPASLVEEFEDKWLTKELIQLLPFKDLYEFRKILSRYRPTPTEDIVGELKECIELHRTCGGYINQTGILEIEKIIRKYEEGK